MKVLSACLLTLLLLGIVQQSDAQACNTTIYKSLTGQISSLKTVVDAAGLADTFDDPALNVTVFAPNNAAITGLINVLNASGLTLANVTGNTNKAANILLYHVATVVATSAQLVDEQSLPSLYTGYNLTVDKNATTVEIEGGADTEATVVTPDVRVCGSIVHIINAVLLPEELNDINNYVPPAPPAPGTPPTPPGTITAPPPPPPGGAASSVGSSLVMGGFAAIAVVLALV
ncbi:hypothetical protein Mapa_015763 [Marchantia paleacea]|nr:hypothetical protein Mapa_015763 [Marchantia paleacea]